jgi:fumarate hydratase class II
MHILWGAQTQRSLHHFHISSEKMAPELVAALAQVKRAAAAVNRSLGKLPQDKARGHRARPPTKCWTARHPGEFPLSVWQTGSGTQSNMNMNEVLANRASELLGGERGEARWCTRTTTSTWASRRTTCSRPRCTWPRRAVAKDLLPALASCAARWK